MFRVNTFAGVPGPVWSVNPELLRATQLVDAVRRDVQSLVPQALRLGAARVSETRIRRWQSALQEAVSLLRSIPVPLIFPPPPFARFINIAVRQISQVLAALAAIPIATLRIYPPRPGRATISLETLQFILRDLQQAETLLFRALQAA